MTVISIAAAARVYKPRVDLAEHGVTDPEPVHRPRREVLQDHIGHLDQGQEALAIGVRLQIE
jgi:hypothetical protein